VQFQADGGRRDESLAMSVALESGRNRIMIYGPKNDGTFVVEFKTATARRLRFQCHGTSRRS
jgi:hypothetical protein